MNTQPELSRVIVDIRRALGVTQERLARDIGSTGRTISRWECGGTPDMASLLRLRQFAESRGVKYLSDQLPIPQAFHKNSERLRVDPGTIAELNWVMPIAISLRNQGYDLAIYRRDTEE